MVSARAALLLLLVAGASAAQQHQPTILLNDERVLVALPDYVLKDRGVHDRLESALTTTFILKARVRGTKNESIVRIEIRYDLWNEIYRVTRSGQNRAAPQLIAKALLEQWWHTPIEIARLG